MGMLSFDTPVVPDGRIAGTMKAAVFVAPGRIELREVPVPEIGPEKTNAVLWSSGPPGESNLFD